MPSKRGKNKGNFFPAWPSRATLRELEAKEFNIKRQRDVELLKNNWRQEFGDNWLRIANEKFTAVSLEYLVKTEDDDEIFVPGEISVSSFTLTTGIVGANFHAFIKPVALPVGYVSEAKFRSEQRHKMPYAGVENGRTDFETIFGEICKLIGRKGGKSVAFCLAEEYKQIESGLRYISGDNDKNKSPYVDLVCVEDLFQALTEWKEQRCVNREQFLPDVDHWLSRSLYDFAPSIRCSFHEGSNTDCPFCSLATVHKIWFHVSEYFAESYEIELTSNHQPGPMRKKLPAAKYCSSQIKSNSPPHVEEVKKQLFTKDDLLKNARDFRPMKNYSLTLVRKSSELAEHFEPMAIEERQEQKLATNISDDEIFVDWSNVVVVPLKTPRLPGQYEKKSKEETLTTNDDDLPVENCSSAIRNDSPTSSLKIPAHPYTFNSTEYQYPREILNPPISTFKNNFRASLPFQVPPPAALPPVPLNWLLPSQPYANPGPVAFDACRIPVFSLPKTRGPNIGKVWRPSSTSNVM